MKQNLKIDSTVSSGEEGKYIVYVYFTWPPLEEALSILTLAFVLLKATFFWDGLIKTNEADAKLNYKLSKNNHL